MKHYTVNFYSLINYGGECVPDGTTSILGYKETFSTSDRGIAWEEYESRMKEVTKDNKLGVTLSIWIITSKYGDMEEIDQLNFDSRDID